MQKVFSKKELTFKVVNLYKNWIMYQRLKFQIKASSSIDLCN